MTAKADSRYEDFSASSSMGYPRYRRMPAARAAQILGGTHHRMPFDSRGERESRFRVYKEAPGFRPGPRNSRDEGLTCGG